MIFKILRTELLAKISGRCSGKTSESSISLETFDSEKCLEIKNAYGKNPFIAANHDGFVY